MTAKKKIYLKEGKISYIRWGGLIYELPSGKCWRTKGRVSKDWIFIGMASSFEEALKKTWDYISSK